MVGAPLYLRPRLEPPLRSLLDDGSFLHSLVDALGSPLNLLLPERLAANLADFRAIFRRHRLDGQVYYAHKANRSSALVRRLAATDAGLDAASLGELRHALGAGFTGDRLLATGPKDEEFLWLAARSGAAVSADGPGELTALAALVRRFGLPRVRVLLRLRDFPAPGVRVLSQRSRFGTPAGELEALLDVLERERGALELTGLAYHLDTTGPAEKALALEGCLAALTACHARGLHPEAIDVGGGFGVCYLAEGAEWERWTTALTNAVLGTGPALTWRGHGYGLRAEGGVLRGALALYPAHRRPAGAAYLDELLSRPAPALGGPLASLLLDHLCRLYAEPGRALLDQCGATLARVVEVRQTEANEHLVRLAMNAADASLEDHGILVDPLLVGREGPVRAGGGEAAGVYLAGNLCLEADLITRRKVFLPRLPRPGELLCFANTAGYCMDFQAHDASLQPRARKIAVFRSGGSWRWCLDERYWPLAAEPAGEGADGEPPGAAGAGEAGRTARPVGAGPASERDA
ncbi:Y4yA family PLP-dependent enzyme [Streptomyces hoynatensis]|uniref:Y4yA family PLP-dependent enzyme n=1 Tax=Streptomyces hoynatensis TaxID=1141874 RepID=A0A3A9Z9W1_9ACTN|nr:Y4yA family PLP-dependent enzyme [Streptomyces hoynatensis]RKN44066.1 Y4yA family PLP-dependent enzyme [Streptomyces hoynatensis]